MFLISYTFPFSPPNLIFFLAQGVGTFLRSQGTMFRNMIFARNVGLSVLFQMDILGITVLFVLDVVGMTVLSVLDVMVMAVLFQSVGIIFRLTKAKEKNM
jgi:hypothetical protein